MPRPAKQGAGTYEWALPEWFEARTVETATGCWEWQGATRNGYGNLRFAGRSIAAHRLAYFMAYGPVPPGTQTHVLHRCDNPPCVNPDHLWLGTHALNMADMARKGRGRWNVRLTEEQVEAIRARRRNGETGTALALEFGITSSTVYKIANHRLRRTRV